MRTSQSRSRAEFLGAVERTEEEKPREEREQSQDFRGGRSILETPGGEARKAEGTRKARAFRQQEDLLMQKEATSGQRGV